MVIIYFSPRYLLSDQIPQVVIAMRIELRGDWMALIQLGMVVMDYIYVCGGGEFGACT